MKYTEMSALQLQEQFNYEKANYEKLKSEGLKLNMARGKPGSAQLDLISDILTVIKTPEDCVSDGIDARNYGELSGLPAAKKLFAEILGCNEEECFIGGSASLNLMYDVISKAMTHGLKNSKCPWSKQDNLKWLCPAPGYDRHFKITESFGFELITIPMTSTGPDMDMVEELIKDPSVKGIWCVPKYSNPDGIVYSSETVHRFASLKPAAEDFTIMWDNAYCIHEFEGEYLPFEDIISLCKEAGNPDMVYEFASTSKVTFPGAGISVMASSVENIKYMMSLLTVEIISYDKINQLRHVKYLKDKEHTLEIMKKHASVLGPKFKCVLDNLSNIEDLGIATWQKPHGGYFVSVNTVPGIAKRTLALCKDAGVVMTGAGATFPYGIDPEDSNIRIAPSYPPLNELESAMKIFCTSLKLAALEKLI